MSSAALSRVSVVSVVVSGPGMTRPHTMGVMHSRAGADPASSARYCAVKDMPASGAHPSSEPSGAARLNPVGSKAMAQVIGKT